MPRAVVATLAAVLLVASFAASPAVAGASADRLQTPDRFDTTTFRVTLYENGSATWAMVHYQPLETENDTEQFRAYATNFEENETELYRDFVTDAEALEDAHEDDARQIPQEDAEDDHGQRNPHTCRDRIERLHSRLHRQ